MDRMWESGRRASTNLSRSISRNLSRNVGAMGWTTDDAFSRGNSRASRVAEDDEEALKWAALERLPTYDRLRTAIMKQAMDERKEAFDLKQVDVRNLGLAEREEFIERVFRVAEEDNDRFLRKVRNRIDK